MESRASEYFASMSPMANRIMADIEDFRRRYGSQWEQLDVREQEELLDAAMIKEDVRARYETRAQLLGDRRLEVPCFPRMQIQPGQKIVHFKEEDIKWQDEHSAPFSWETKSQIDLSLSDFPPVGSQSLSEATPSAVPRPAPSRGRTLSGGGAETLSPARRGGADGVEFGKGLSGPLAARLAGEPVQMGDSSGSIDDDGADDDYECSSLTPSQIKLLERDGQERNGRFDSSGTGREKAGQEAPWVKRQPVTIPGGGSLVLGGSEVEQLPRWNRQNSDSRSEPPTLSENPLPAEPPKPRPKPPKSVTDSQEGLGQGEDVVTPVISEDQNSKVTLKTGFDFLDNCRPFLALLDRISLARGEAFFMGGQTYPLALTPSKRFCFCNNRVKMFISGYEGLRRLWRGNDVFSLSNRLYLLILICF